MSDQDFIERIAFDKLKAHANGNYCSLKKEYSSIHTSVEYSAYLKDSEHVEYSWSKCYDNPMDAVNEVIGEAKPNELSRS